MRLRSCKGLTKHLHTVAWLVDHSSCLGIGNGLGRNRQEFDVQFFMHTVYLN